MENIVLLINIAKYYINPCYYGQYLAFALFKFPLSANLRDIKYESN